MAIGRTSAGINKAGGKNVNPVYKELGGTIPTLEEFAKKIRSQKLPNNKKYESTPKGVKQKVKNIETKILKSFGMNN